MRPAQGFQIDVALAHRQIVALDQRETEIARR